MLEEEKNQATEMQNFEQRNNLIIWNNSNISEYESS